MMYRYVIKDYTCESGHYSLTFATKEEGDAATFARGLDVQDIYLVPDVKQPRLHSAKEEFEDACRRNEEKRKKHFDRNNY